MKKNPPRRAESPIPLLSLEERLSNLDGKTLHGTVAGEETQGRHLLAIQQAGTNPVLAQVLVEEKINEISAAPHLLKTKNFSGKIVSGDAMHAQRNLSRQIVQAGEVNTVPPSPRCVLILLSIG